MPELADEMKPLKPGTISLDDTRLSATASCHRTLSHGPIQVLDSQIEADVQEFLTLAESADQAELPDEIERQQDRLLTMDAAKAKIEARWRP